ncbi:MAG: hypothetical protein PHQ66_00740 [Candidatus Nanoarchaeia archaeon]|nr:hypothetical protein [Candidatus Nanoarchaeia archaeon]MDD5358495.1 hypothetical protein [Candidatus Nanoarchaeia archaeon]MDD5589009.1 hypothetical protein [Candidatus Nanoarchaeia archaeon]
MKKEVAVILLSLVFVSVLIFFIFPKTGFVINSVDASQLENLRLRAEVECLQNSQCSENSECVENVCVNKTEIDLCRKINLYTPTNRLKIGDSINSVKTVLTKAQIPSLLSGGELVEIIDDKLVNYFYTQLILIGDNKLEKNIEEYAIEKDKPLFTYRLVFSNGIDFSDKNIQGQVLRILGEEYIIGSNSDDSNIYLISEKKNIKLNSDENIKIIKNKEENVLEINFNFFPSDNLRVNESFSESTFNAIKLSFYDADDNFADVGIGGNC